MSKLIVAGCSVSDYTEVDRVWGDYLAEHLGLEYKHLAAQCGSNDRLFRLLTNDIRNNIIEPDDIVMVQYTTIERTEFWSGISPLEPDALRDPYDDGSIIKFKFRSHETFKGIECKFTKMYERFINHNFELEKFINNHVSFQCLAKEYNIHNLYFVKVGEYGWDEITYGNIPLIPKYKDNFLNYRDLLQDDKWRLAFDNLHLSEQGHKELASRVFARLNTNKG
tara:strand:- start:5124 stop:5792 length:669 start_codon:yes stop_codon:yes gene_type:complete